MAASLAVGAPLIFEGDVPVVLGGVSLVAFATLRALLPDLRLSPVQRRFALVLEVLITSAVVVGTGYWESPYLPSLITPILAAGLTSGFVPAFFTGLGIAVAVNIPLLAFDALDDLEGGLEVVPRSAALLILFALVAGYARRISGEAERRRSIALDRLGRLADANDLLFSLHQAAQALPASLDLDEALDSTLDQMRELFDADSSAILLFDETDATFTVVRRNNIRSPETMSVDQLPPPLQHVIKSRHALAQSNLIDRGGPGLQPSSGSGLYVALRGRDALIGVLVLESAQTRDFDQRAIELLDGFAEPAALAIDNARWFSRLRTIGADEERTRIARDLHDRIGQSVAYLAFELDRLVKKAEDDQRMSAALTGLRDDVRGVVSELRETLYDLRTDVTEESRIVDVLTQYLDRVRDRTSLDVRFEHRVTGSLPLPQERELWRIAQEAVTNVERHAQASELRVAWTCNGSHASLTVTDNGRGFPPGKAGRLDSYGMVGMRERAAAISARLDISSRPGTGTRVECRVDPDLRTRSSKRGF